jgi:hypothetical protein
MFINEFESRLENEIVDVLVLLYLWKQAVGRETLPLCKFNSRSDVSHKIIISGSLSFAPCYIKRA